MALQIVFQNNLSPGTINLSSRFTDATGFYISAPFIANQYQIDVYLQIYFPTETVEQVRVISLGLIEETAILLNQINTERVSAIPIEYLNTGYEMALAFVSSDETFIQAAIIKPECTLSTVCNSLDSLKITLSNIQQQLDRIESKTGNTNPTPAELSSNSATQQLLFFR